MSEENRAALLSRPADIEWDHLDKPRFFSAGLSMFMCIRAMVYPSQLIKTRIVIGRKGAVYPSTFLAYTTIIRQEGFRALYRGFTVSAVSSVPIQGLYITSYEVGRAVFKRALVRLDPETDPVVQDFLSNGIGGALASMSAQLIVIPVDVITQRLMIQKDGTTGYKNGLDAFWKIVTKEGYQGLYKGFLPSVLTYVPGNAIWWASYGYAKTHVHNFAVTMQPNELHMSHGKEVLIQTVSAVLASTTSVTVTQPMDIVKTQMQTGVLDQTKKHTVTSVFLRLIKEEGLAGITKGWTARWMSSVPVSSLTMLVYEFTKRVSLKPEYRREH